VTADSPRSRAAPFLRTIKKGEHRDTWEQRDQGHSALLARTRRRPYPSPTFFAPLYNPLALSPSASPHSTAFSHGSEPGSCCAATYPTDIASPNPTASGVAHTYSWSGVGAVRQPPRAVNFSASAVVKLGRTVTRPARLQNRT